MVEPKGCFEQSEGSCSENDSMASFVILHKETGHSPSIGDAEHSLESSISLLNIGACGQVSKQNLRTTESVVANLSTSFSSDGNAQEFFNSWQSMSPSEKDLLVSQLLEQNTCLRDTIEQNNLRLKQQVQALSNITQFEEVFKEHKERFAELRSLVLKLQAEKLELQQKCEKHCADQLSKLKEENWMLQRKIETLEKENTYNSREVQKLVSTVYDLSAQQAEADHHKATLHAEIGSLKTMLHEIKLNGDATVQRLRGHIDDMTATIVGKEEEISVLKSELQKVQEEISKGEESTAILKAITDVYQSDFLMERGERELIAGELWKVKQDFKALHQQYVELRMSSGSSSHTEHNADDNSNPTSQPRIQCPKCCVSFQNYHLLQLHVEECLQLS